MYEIVGRDEELASLRAFIGRAEGEPTALVLEGQAGIGKSTLWLRRGRVCALARDARALVAAGRGRAGLAYAGWAICSRTSSTSLAVTRRAAAASARDRAPARGGRRADAVDPRALGIATRDALQLLAESEPVLLAIDDVQWVDASSSAALAFALRRLARTR